MGWKKFIEETPPMETVVALRLTRTVYEDGEKEEVEIQKRLFKFRRPFDYAPDKFQVNFYQIKRLLLDDNDFELHTPDLWKDFVSKSQTEWLLLE